jgi:hypothetical protein
MKESNKIISSAKYLGDFNRSIVYLVSLGAGMREGRTKTHKDTDNSSLSLV